MTNPSVVGIDLGSEGDRGNGHKLARIVYNLMRYGLAYSRQEEALYADQVRARLEKQLHRRAKELGFTVVKVEAPASDSEVSLPPAV